MIKLVHDVGGRVFCIMMSDNLSVNRKNCKMLHETFRSESVSSVAHPFPNSKFYSLFTLYDPTYLFKNVRNNWITEKTQTLEFLDPEINEVFTAKWKDLIEIYTSELESDIKGTKLNHTTLYPQ